ncbi:MAG: hypothetical protein GY877_11960, partial [Hyphomicrobium sp.]|nr:hypothetical protein [Hyphomicrobium sp.]
LEIVGELVERLGLDEMGAAGVDGSLVEELVAIKQISGIVDWIEARVGAARPTTGVESGGTKRRIKSSPEGAASSQGLGRSIEPEELTDCG